MWECFFETGLIYKTNFCPFSLVCRIHSLLRAFTKLGKATIGSVMSVRLSACPREYNLAPTGRISKKFNIFRKYVEKIRVELKFDKNNESLI
jgi:hypothetical protein